MSTFRELTYLVLDELKIIADDSTFTEDHVIFILSKYRSFLLKQRYSDIKKQIPYNNYQTICLNMVEVPTMSGGSCSLEGLYMKSIENIPFLMMLGNPRIYTDSFYEGDITYINRERMRYVGYNRFIPNTVYGSLAPDNYLYLKSFKDTIKEITEVKFTAIFQDAILASELYCDKDCELLDREFPIEDALVPPLVELTVKELSLALYKPKDIINNNNDDLSEIKTK